ncbi:hypothetical protein SESBI_01986 [Sesbania bispinosa]|nr:hypothetical protein SESBI_01986 [Sesbania bispinosa]
MATQSFHHCPAHKCSTLLEVNKEGTARGAAGRRREELNRDDTRIELKTAGRRSGDADGAALVRRADNGGWRESERLLQGSGCGEWR